MIFNVSADRIGLGFSHDAFNLCTSHVHPFFIHTFFLFFPILSMCCVLSLSLSLGQTMSWHPNNANLFQLGVLMVQSHRLLLFLPYPLIFGSVMRRPRRTSLRTSRPVAFIRNAKSFCQISPTLRYPKSFRLRDGNLYVRDPCVVPSFLFRSFTPTYMASISICYYI